MKIYRVVVTREGDAWLADAPNVDGVHTWARNLPNLDAAIREAIALAEDLPEGAEPHLWLQYEYHTSVARFDTQSKAIREAREQISQQVEAVERQTAEAAREMAASLSVRDVAALLGISPQLVSQVALKKIGRKAA